MRTPVNVFKQRLGTPQAQIGLWLGLTDPVCAEIAAGAGFDWVLLDGEHAPHDVRSLLALLQAVAAYPVHPIVRVPIGDATIIKQVLDIGAQTVLVPMVESAEQARQLARAVRYPPAGFRGVGTALARAARWNRSTDYLARANDEVCLIVQVETKRGLEEIDAIAAVDGVDAVFVGPADLAAALGHLGNPAHPEVQAAISDAFRRIQAAGKAAGCLSADEKLARSFIAAGCRFVAVGTDTVLLANATRALAAKFTEARPDTPPVAGQVY